LKIKTKPIFFQKSNLGFKAMEYDGVVCGKFEGGNKRFCWEFLGKILELNSRVAISHILK